MARPHKGALFCQIGYRAFIDNEWFNGRWSPLQLPLSIAYKELFPVVLAAHVWGPHRHILFHVDNETVVHILNMPLALRGHMTNAFTWITTTNLIKKPSKFFIWFGVC